MPLFETILLMLAAAVALIAAARRLGLPYPVLLALAGAIVAVAPIEVELHPDPQLVLALFVAPVLLDAAYDTSLRDLRRNWIAVGSLALIAVGLTTAAVATVMRLMMPDLPLAAAIAIGAIVAPPDAVAAVAVLRDVKLPHRIGVILEGEALLNDAATLLIFRLAVSAVAAGGGIAAEAIAPAFLLSLVGSLVAGPAVAAVTSRLVPRIADAPSSIIVQFVTTFGIWVLAERIGLSPILTLVSYAMTVARLSGARMPARLRIPSYAVWETVVIVLNVLAFLLIGLELGPVLAAARPGEIGRWATVGGAVLGTVIAVRLVWTILSALSARRLIDRGGAEVAGPRPNFRSGLVIGWAGMRGIVTVATALALPADFPERPMLVFVAFAVTLGTLLLHGLTLRPLVLLLRLGQDDTIERELRHARAASARHALAALDGETGEGIAPIREELHAEAEIAEAAEEGDGRPVLAVKATRARVLAARRDALVALRADGTIGDDAFHRLEEELDFADIATATRT